MENYTVKWYGKQVTADITAAGISGLMDAAEHLLDESNKLAPIDEGNLIRSGQTSVDTNKLEAVVSYDTPYAIKQHEDRTLSHKNGRQAGFLQSAYQNNIQRIRDLLAKSIKGEL